MEWLQPWMDFTLKMAIAIAATVATLWRLGITPLSERVKMHDLRLDRTERRASATEVKTLELEQGLMLTEQARKNMLEHTSRIENLLDQLRDELGVQRGQREQLSERLSGIEAKLQMILNQNGHQR